MEIKQLTSEELNHLMQSEEVSGWTSLPISPLRLSAQMKNPHLLRDDIVMVIAVDNDDLAGYMVALPDDLMVGKTNHHIAWGSTLWTNPAHRRKGIGKMLAASLNSAWKDKLFLTEFTMPSKPVYDQLDLFESFYIKKGHRYFYRSILHSIAKGRFSNNKIILGLLRLTDRVLNFFLAMRVSVRSYFGKKIKYRWRDWDVNNIPPELFPPSIFSNYWKKTHWIFTNPWLSSDKSAGCERYFFTTLVDRFQFRAISFFNRDHFPIALLVYSRINNEVKILSFFIISAPGIDSPSLKRNLEQFFMAERINSVLSYDARFDNLMGQGGSIFFYRRRRTREYLVSRALFEQLPVPEAGISEIDGDAVFT